MLDLFEQSDIAQYIAKLPDGRDKALLNKLLFEYVEYARCGTVEDCRQRKEWMSYSIDDIRVNFTKVVNGLREEVAYIREDAAKQKRRGRPRKS